HDAGALAHGRGGRLREQPPAFTCHEVCLLDGSLHFAPGILARLARLAPDDLGEVTAIALHDRGHAANDRTPSNRRFGGPGGERTRRGVDGALEVVMRGARYVTDQFAADRGQLAERDSGARRSHSSIDEVVDAIGQISVCQDRYLPVVVTIR